MQIDAGPGMTWTCLNHDVVELVKNHGRLVTRASAAPSFVSNKVLVAISTHESRSQPKLYEQRRSRTKRRIPSAMPRATGTRAKPRQGPFYTRIENLCKERVVPGSKEAGLEALPCEIELRVHARVFFESRIVVIFA